MHILEKLTFKEFEFFEREFIDIYNDALEHLLKDAKKDAKKELCADSPLYLTVVDLLIKSFSLHCLSKTFIKIKEGK